MPFGRVILELCILAESALAVTAFQCSRLAVHFRILFQFAMCQSVGSGSIVSKGSRKPPLSHRGMYVRYRCLVMTS